MRTSESLFFNSNEELIIDIETMELEEQIRRLLIFTRLSCNMTQKQLSEKSGIRQSNISRIECGSCTPTLETLKELASAMDKRIKIEFI